MDRVTFRDLTTSLPETGPPVTTPYIRQTAQIPHITFDDFSSQVYHRHRWNHLVATSSEERSTMYGLVIMTAMSTGTVVSPASHPGPSVSYGCGASCYGSCYGSCNGMGCYGSCHGGLFHGNRGGMFGHHRHSCNGCNGCSGWSCFGSCYGSSCSGCFGGSCYGGCYGTGMGPQAVRAGYLPDAFG